MPPAQRTIGKNPLRLIIVVALVLLLLLQIGAFDLNSESNNVEVDLPITDQDLDPIQEEEAYVSDHTSSTTTIASISNEDVQQRKPLLDASSFYKNLPDLKVPLSSIPKPLYIEDNDLATPQSSATSSKPACPVWKAYDPIFQASKDFSDNCKQVSLVKEYKTVFDVNLCESRTHCGQGYFLVSRKDMKACETEFGQILSNNEQLDAYLKKNVGPVEYFLLWPEVILKNILPETFELDVCSTAACKSFSAKSLEKMKLPLCSRELPNQGVYLKMTLETERETYKFDNYKKGYIWAPLGCKYDQLFELDSLSTCHTKRNYSMLMYGDSHNRVLWDAVDVRLAGSKRHLGKNPKDGDRDAWFHEDRMTGLGHSGDGKFAGREYALRPFVKEKMNKDKKYVHNVMSLNHTRIRHLWGNYLQKLVHDHGEWDDAKKVVALDKELAEYDVFEFDWGHWGSGPEKNNGHYTVERFLDHLEVASDYLVQINTRRGRLGVKPLTVIWQGVNSIPLIKYAAHDWQVADQDWRNNYRFKVWSMFAERAMLRRGFRVMNSFDITFPWIQETEDANHVHTLPALDAQVDELLHKLNICDF
ncbi:UNVERIFIED_CONTAM: hypothetical protein HDU68_008263 [Siphonaria sp. JEL0065]|nr:hypothetical protein HDU68_008263 [Siphonaria sp. JEL0065]